MRPSNSSTSSSSGTAVEELPRVQTPPSAPAGPPITPSPHAHSMPGERRRRVRGVVAAVGWTLLFLAMFDVGINRAFRYPADPKQRPTSLQEYFEYGRSINGKLNRLIGPTDEESPSISRAGWLAGNPRLYSAPTPGPGQLGVRVYGMSFSDQVADDLSKMDPSLKVSTFDGPAAPPNHSYAAYTLERGKIKADVVAFGILASSVPMLDTMTMMTSTFESPAVFTYPRYRVAGEKLVPTWPMFKSLSEFRAGRADPREWQAYMQQLAANDVYYAPSLFGATWLDHSALARVARRAWAQRHVRQVRAELHNAKGYSAETDLVPVLQAMVANFARSARADHQVPVVLLFNDQGFGEDLYRAVEPVLKRDGIPYVSSHRIAPATDHRNFVADGHFTPEITRRLAVETLKVIHAQTHTPMPAGLGGEGALSK